MQKSMRLVLSLALMLFVFSIITGCGGGGSGGDSSSSINLTGNWSGTWEGTDSGNVSANLTHSGTSITGTASISNSPCISSGDVSGSVSENNITFGLVSGTDEIAYTGEFTSTTISGSYQVLSGACAGDTGTFELTKQ